MNDLVIESKCTINEENNFSVKSISCKSCVVFLTKIVAHESILVIIVRKNNIFVVYSGHKSNKKIKFANTIYNTELLCL